MKNVKHILALFSLAIFASNSSSAGEIRTFSHQGDDYTIETRWINTQVSQEYFTQSYNGLSWNYSPSFFVKNDLIYFTKDLSQVPSTCMLIADGQTGIFKNVAEINWGSIDHNTVAAVYAGVDSEGTYYVASYGTSTINGYPFRIYPLEFLSDGTPKAIGYYELKMGAECWIKSVDVQGSLLSGNFSAASYTWNSLEIISNQELKTGVSVWDFYQGQQTSRKDYNLSITVPDIKLISDNKIAIHDRHLLFFNHPGYTIDYGQNAVAKNPTLYSIEENSLNLHSEISPLEDTDGFGNGMAFFSLGDDNHFAIYASAGAPVEFRLVSLPDYPESFENAEELLTIVKSTDNLSSVNNRSMRHKSGVFIEKPDENTANIYLAGHENGMAAYTLKREASLNTGIDAITAGSCETTEYYTVTGIRISGKPTSGFYIEKTGGKANIKFSR